MTIYTLSTIWDDFHLFPYYFVSFPFYLKEKIKRKKRNIKMKVGVLYIQCTLYRCRRQNISNSSINCLILLAFMSKQNCSTLNNALHTEKRCHNVIKNEVSRLFGSFLLFMMLRILFFYYSLCDTSEKANKVSEITWMMWATRVGQIFHHHWMLTGHILGPSMSIFFVLYNMSETSRCWSNGRFQSYSHGLSLVF